MMALEKRGLDPDTHVEEGADEEEGKEGKRKGSKDADGNVKQDDDTDASSVATEDLVLSEDEPSLLEGSDGELVPNPKKDEQVR